MRQRSHGLFSGRSLAQACWKLGERCLDEALVAHLLRGRYRSQHVGFAPAASQICVSGEPNISADDHIFTWQVTASHLEKHDVSRVCLSEEERKLIARRSMYLDGAFRFRARTSSAHLVHLSTHLVSKLGSEIGKYRLQNRIAHPCDMSLVQVEVERQNDPAGDA